MTVEIPETIGRLLPIEPSQRLRSVTEGLVLGAYTQGIITRGLICGRGRVGHHTAALSHSDWPGFPQAGQ